MRILALASLLISIAWGGAQADSTNVIRMATTTSTENSGLLDYLLPEFESGCGHEVRGIAVGTGAAKNQGKAPVYA